MQLLSFPVELAIAIIDTDAYQPFWDLMREETKIDLTKQVTITATGTTTVLLCGWEGYSYIQHWCRIYNARSRPTYGMSET